MDFEMRRRINSVLATTMGLLALGALPEASSEASTKQPGSDGPNGTVNPGQSESLAAIALAVHHGASSAEHGSAAHAKACTEESTNAALAA